MEILKKQENWPDHIIIIGSGRWARVIIKELCNKVPLSVKLYIHSRHHAESINLWLKELSTNRKFCISSGWPPPSLPQGKIAAIIVNAAKDHSIALEWALENCSSVLVEKPIVPSEQTLHQFITLAEKKKCFLAPAHVFLFAPYVENFKNIVVNSDAITSLSFDWSDPKAEIRYGEKKQYDAGLPVYADWLPHIIPLIGVLVGGLPESCEDIQIDKGGAAVKINLKVKKISCHINLERNASQRRRVIRVISDNIPYELDFSTEPGIIRYKDITVSAGDNWGKEEGPLSQMLHSFLLQSESSLVDSRLSLNPAIHTCKLIDEVQKKYLSDIMMWICSKLNRHTKIDENIRYALTEILLNNSSISVHKIDHHLNLIEQYFHNPDAKNLLHIEEPFKFINRIATS